MAIDFSLLNDFEKSLYNELEGLEGDNGQNYEVGTTGGTSVSTYSNRLFGAPFQLLDSVDRRFPNINPHLGNEYLRNFMLNSPILHIRPGMPKYTGDMTRSPISNTLRDIYADTVKGSMGLGEAIWKEGVVNGLIFGSGKKLQNRMFGFKETYYDYIQHVNYMCQTVATYMNLTGSSGVPSGCYVSGGSWQDFKSMDWQNYRMTSERPLVDPTKVIGAFGDVIADNFAPVGGFGNLLTSVFPGGNTPGEGWNTFKESLSRPSSSSFLSVIDSKISSVEFMVEPIQFTEVLTNSTKQSMIESAIDSITNGVGTEIAWITNSRADKGIIENLTDFLGDGLQSVSEVLSGLTAPVTGGFTHNLFSGALGALKGQKMIYPKIYDRSESSMNYNFSITLTTPYGDPYNYYMNIIVPLLHLIALVAPRMVTSNTVASPYLVQAYIPGMCTCQLGIISQMTITKNPNQKHVSVNGFPLTVKVEFTIEELYNAMSISPANDPASFFYNETLNDYLANIAGLAPSVDTYAKQREAMFQAEERFWDKKLWLEDGANRITEWTTDFFTPPLSH